MDHSNITLIKWERVVKPIACGGLGIRTVLQQMNVAFMVKLGWMILQNNNELWARVLRDKYMYHKTNPQDLRNKPGASNLWKGIVKGRDILLHGMRNLVGNGNLHKLLDG